MKSYILNNWYPSLPDQWKGKSIKVHWFSDAQVYAHGSVYISREEVENNPEHWKQSDKVLFTTEDGVDIYEDDTYYILSVHGDVLERTAGYGIRGVAKCFSSPEELRFWQNENKHQFSLRDIKDAFNVSVIERGSYGEIHTINEQEFFNQLNK